MSTETSKKMTFCDSNTCETTKKFDGSCSIGCNWPPYYTGYAPQETKLITMTIDTYNELIRKAVLYEEIMKEADSEIIDPTGRYEGC